MTRAANAQALRRQRAALALLALVALSAGFQVAAAVDAAAAAPGAAAAQASAASLIPSMAQMQEAAAAANNFIATVKSLKQTVDKVPALGNYLNRTLEQIPGIDKLAVLGDGLQLSDLSAVHLPTSLDELKSLKLPNFDFKAVEGGKVALNLTGIAGKFGVDLGALTEQFKGSKLGEIASVPAEKFNRLPKGVRQALVWVTVANVVGAAGIKTIGPVKAAAAKMGISGGSIMALMAGKGLGGGGAGAAEVAAEPAAAAAAAPAAGLPKLSSPKFDLKAIASKFGVKVEDPALGADDASMAAAAAAEPMMSMDDGAMAAAAPDAAMAAGMKPESGSASRPQLPAAVVHERPELCGCPSLVAPVCTGRNLDFDNECLARCTGARVINQGTCAQQPQAPEVSFDGVRRRRLLLIDGAMKRDFAEEAEMIASSSSNSGRALQGLLGRRRNNNANSLDAALSADAAAAGGLGPFSALRLAASAARAVGGQYGSGERASARRAPESVDVGARSGAAHHGSRRVVVRVTVPADGSAPIVRQSLVKDGLEALPFAGPGSAAAAQAAAEASDAAAPGTVDVSVKPAAETVADGLKAQIKARTG
jgi:hypothetical protein